MGSGVKSALRLADKCFRTASHADVHAAQGVKWRVNRRGGVGPLGERQSLHFQGHKSPFISPTRCGMVESAFFSSPWHHETFD